MKFLPVLKKTFIYLKNGNVEIHEDEVHLVYNKHFLSVQRSHEYSYMETMRKGHSEEKIYRRNLDVVEYAIDTVERIEYEYTPGSVEESPDEAEED